MTDRHQSPSYPLRLPVELKNQVTDAAAAMGRSFNAEIIARLQGSFDLVAGLPFPVQEAIDMEMEERGGTPEEALTRLSLAALAQGGTVLYAQISQKMTFQEFRDMLEAGKKIIPPDSAMVIDGKLTRSLRG